MNLTSLTQKVHSFTYELYLGIQTKGRVDSTIAGYGYYSPLPYLVILAILKRLGLKQDDVFVDVGCGKGRVVCCACRLPICRVVGIEVNKELLDQALVNVTKMHGQRCEFEPVAGQAEEYDFHDTTALLLFNPFDIGPMRQVIDKLSESYKASPRLIKIAYANCLYQQPMEAATWLRKSEEWSATRFAGFGRAVSFWESV